MALIVPRSYTGSSVRPVIQERHFRMQLRCLDCRTVADVEIEMHDELGDPATIDDFYAAGAVEQIRPKCTNCGGEGFVLIDTQYIPTASDARGME